MEVSYRRTTWIPPLLPVLVGQQTNAGLGLKTRRLLSGLQGPQKTAGAHPPPISFRTEITLLPPRPVLGRTPFNSAVVGERGWP